MLIEFFNIKPKFAIQRIFLIFSLIFAILSLCLWCFNYFPFNLVPVGPPQLNYSMSYLGAFLFIVSFVWWPFILKHKKVIISTTLLLAWGYAITRYNANLYSEDIGFSAILRYRGWLLVPMLYFMWFAIMFSMMNRENIKKIFIYSVIIGFGINSIHVILEIIANLGFNSVKDFLIAMNPFFRIERIGGDWWPPAYFNGRIRGFYGEPSYFAGGSIPFFGICWYLYKKHAQKAWLILPFLLCTIFFYDFTLTGLIGVSVFFYFAILLAISSKRGRKMALKAGIGIIIITMLSSLAVLHTTPFGANIQKTVKTALLVSEHFEKQYAGETVEPLEIAHNSTPVYKIFTRLVVTLVGFKIAEANPLGVGMGLHSPHWKSLETANLNGNEMEQWIQSGYISPVSLYNNYIVEIGIIGLLLFLYIVFYVMHRAYKYYANTKDIFTICMLLILISYLAMFVSLRLDHAFAFVYCLGILYAYTNPSAVKSNN